MYLDYNDEMYTTNVLMYPDSWLYWFA